MVSEEKKETKDVHDGKDTTLCFGSLSYSFPDFISQIPNAVIARLDLALSREPLQERTVHAMEGHPMKVPSHGLGVTGGKEMDGVARGCCETGCGVEFGGVVVGGVGPEVGVGTTTTGNGKVEPV